VRDGITAGCGGGNYCPDDTVTRGQMAVFIGKSMRGTANWPPRLSQVSAVLNSDGSVDEVASGNALLAAAAAIPSTGPAAPDVGNHWLLKVGPGNFDLGNQYLSLLPYVDLEGAGMYTTTVTSGIPLGAAATIKCTGTSIITNVSVVNTGGPGGAIAIQNGDGKLYLNRVKALAMAGTDYNQGVDIVNNALEMQESEAWAIGGSAVALAIVATSSPYMEIRNSYFVSSLYAVSNGTDAMVRIANSRISGTLWQGSPGHYSCYGNYNAAMNVAVICP